MNNLFGWVYINKSNNRQGVDSGIIISSGSFVPYYSHIHSLRAALHIKMKEKSGWGAEQLFCSKFPVGAPLCLSEVCFVTVLILLMFEIYL